MKSRARNQGGENQFTTDLFLTASECWMKPSHSPWLEGLDRARWLSHTSSSKRVVLAVPNLIKHLAGRLMGIGRLIKTLEYPSHRPILDDFHSYLLFLLPMGGVHPTLWGAAHQSPLPPGAGGRWVGSRRLAGRCCEARQTAAGTLR